MTARNRAIRTTQLPDDQTARSSPPLPCGPPPLPPPPCSSALSSCPLEVVAGDSWSARINIKRAISVVLYIVQDPISYCQLSDYERIESDLLYSTCKERKKPTHSFEQSTGSCSVRLTMWELSRTYSTYITKRPILATNLLYCQLSVTTDNERIELY